ncbi:cyclophilin-like fold protein [Motiliproteus sp. SC1-56]|uniref:cyclophilin-like fold protein n=1 Tax=Motiliproteus sp. SC1-56 TaxID=2799565 RepID=UPI001A908568|nr:cyclophilin-like fold protein [Motiliproteus sp. SC1-56]
MRKASLKRRSSQTGSGAMLLLALAGGLWPLDAHAASVSPGPQQASSAATPVSIHEESTMKIHLRLDGATLTATLLDTPAAKDFIDLLPLTLTLKDYAATEKVADLPRKLSTEGAPAGFKPDIGDITFYTPWGNLAIFYRPFRYSTGLVPLGRIEGDIAPLKASGPLQVEIIRAQDEGGRP